MWDRVSGPVARWSLVVYSTDTLLFPPLSTRAALLILITCITAVPQLYVIIMWVQGVRPTGTDGTNCIVTYGNVVVSIPYMYMYMLLFHIWCGHIIWSVGSRFHSKTCQLSSLVANAYQGLIGVGWNILCSVGTFFQEDVVHWLFIYAHTHTCRTHTHTCTHTHTTHSRDYYVMYCPFPIPSLMLASTIFTVFMLGEHITKV